jgi:HSP20 family protein
MKIMPARTLIPAFDRLLSVDADLDRILGRANGAAPTWTPAFDVIETDESYIVTAELPGVDPNATELTFERNVLTLRGTKPGTSASEDQRVHLAERAGGSFSRSLRLPGLVDADRIEAANANGLLTVTIPKAAQAKPRKIEIR